MAKELELKLSCTEALSFAQLEQTMLSAGAAQTDLTQSGPAQSDATQADVTQDNAAQIKIMQLENIYFDTEDLTLHKNKVALRIRKKGVAPNTHYIQTLKTAGKSVNGVSQRGEWEWELAKPILSTKALESLDVWTAQLHATNLQLKPVFRTDFQRTAKIVQWGGHHFELVLDEGEITVPGTKKAQPIHEVEIEYLGSASAQSEPQAAMLELSAMLREKLPLSADDISKAQRGYALFHQAK
jgi:inorganic triphosphatase YgiF